MEWDHVRRRPIEYGTPEYLEHVGQHPGRNGWPVEQEDPGPREPPPSWREIGHQAAEEFRAVSMWDVYRGPLIVVGLIVLALVITALA